MSAAVPRFRLVRWFSLLSLGLIAGVGALGVALLGWFVTEHMLRQEGELTRDFVHSLVRAEVPLQAFFAAPMAGPSAAAEDSLRHFSAMPDVLRTNVYAADRTLVWSSDPALIGRRFGANDELERALAGAVVVERKTQAQRAAGKPEHVGMVEPEDLFVEIYVPVTDAAGRRVLGAIEFYRHPRTLMASLAQLRRWLALGAAGFGALLFAVLYGLARRADTIMRDQEQRLVRQETFAVLGEMSSAVAHAIRNPLASIRSSAELILESPADAGAQEPARDIVAAVDRLGTWLRELLSQTRPPAGAPAPLALAPLVQGCVQALARELQRRGIHAALQLPADLPAVRADAHAVEQVLHSVLCNAIEAAPLQGHIAVAAERVGPRVRLQVRDDGPGLTEAQRTLVGEPFFTTKPQGLGVGLALARRLLERQGGQLGIDSAPGRGTVVSITLRIG
jgi:two-component system sensor histidine kinase HydH